MWGQLAESCYIIVHILPGAENVTFAGTFDAPINYASDGISCSVK